ncbi:MAG: hypothetical protein LBD37_09040 [Treponema sp.]|jgi:hypothetical protein|nr:hypothetical protein [Treponema sp.]
MRLVCLDLEGILIPKIWIAFADAWAIRASCADIPATDTYQNFMAQIDAFLQGQP